MRVFFDRCACARVNKKGVYIDGMPGPIVRHPDEGQDPFHATIMILAPRGRCVIAMRSRSREWIPASAGMTKRARLQSI
jgi:hypothetical protein